MTKLSTAAAILLAATLAVAGCKSSAPTQTVAPTPATAPVANAGSIAGTIHFTGKPPAPVEIDMSMDPACTMVASSQNDAEQYVIANGKLANVYVYIKAGAPPSKAPASAAPVVLDQKGCRYSPHVIAVQQGGSVQFRNSDPTMHNVHTTPANPSEPSIDVSQGPMGAAQTRQFSQPEVMLPVRCNNHPWMNAFINVSATPFFAVSGADGSFTISGLPPGNYTLAAVHEKLGEQDIQITVPPSGTAKADFSYSMK